MEMARCMLGNITKFIWGEVVSMTIYTFNRYPKNNLREKLLMRHGQEINLTFHT